MLLTRVGEFARRLGIGAGAGTVAAAAEWLPPLSGIAAFLLHVCDEVVQGHGFEFDFLIRVAQIPEKWKLLHEV